MGCCCRWDLPERHRGAATTTDGGGGSAAMDAQHWRQRGRQQTMAGRRGGLRCGRRQGAHRARHEVDRLPVLNAVGSDLIGVLQHLAAEDEPLALHRHSGEPPQRVLELAHGARRGDGELEA
jgi:hypothetical protein